MSGDNRQAWIKGVLLMSTQTLAWRAGPPGPPAAPPRRLDTKSPQWLTRSLLILACAVLLALACASAWLSYHAQVAYVRSRNGDEPTQARVWALLLDAGTAGVSLLRLHEALRQRAGGATRVSLLGCIAASVTLNLLHSPSRTPGGYVVAAVPPVMYAVFLEHLLANLRSLLTAQEKRRSAWRTLLLWLNFPALMWNAHRDALRREAEGLHAAPDFGARRSRALMCPGASAVDEVEQFGDGAEAPEVQSVQRYSRRGRGLGAKRIAFEAVLAQQVRSGDLRLFSRDERERNAAAYQAAASLPVPLSRGAARRYVVQALPRLEASAPVGWPTRTVVAPDGA